MSTGCTCTSPGYCERHKMNKTARMFHLCQTNQDYFDNWDGVVKPQKPAYTSHIGDILARRFESIGLQAVKGCPCKDLQAKLNRYTPSAAESDLHGLAVQLNSSARKWKELKGGLWNLVPAPPIWLCKQVLTEAINEAKGAISKEE